MTTQTEDLLLVYRDRMRKAFAKAPSGLADEFVPSMAENPLGLSAIEELQSDLPVALPQSFLTYLQGPVAQNGIESNEILLPNNDDLKVAREFLMQTQLWEIELLQFAAGPCGDPVCFDFSDVRDGSEYPVVVINHDLAPRTAWSNAILIRRYTSARWTNFTELFRVICRGEKIRYSISEPDL